MKLQEFYYDLPHELIAQYPLRRRDQARLMVVDRNTKKICHDKFSSIDKYLPEKSVVVLNDSKVIPARLFGRKEKTGGRVEVFLLKKINDGYSYEVLFRPLKKVKLGDEIIFNGDSVKATVVDKEKKIVRFNKKGIEKYLNKIGHVPLPPYIKRLDEKLDQKYYQTVYAKKNGSVASPTAGLHFTKSLLKKLGNNHSLQTATLHVNHATFKLVKEENIEEHKMHFEEYIMAEKVYQAINEAKKEGKKVVAVGTTSCRVLETVANTQKLEGATNLFIYPGYVFQWADVLLTNFHLPYSTLLMLAYAFGGVDLIRKAYTEAIREKYRFFSYGDAMLII